MTINVTIKDAVSDLYEVRFNNNLINFLAPHIYREPIFLQKDGELVESGNRFVMNHETFIELSKEMAFI